MDGKQGIKDLKQIMGDSIQYDFVELPPIDSLREVIYSAYIVYVCKKKNIKIGYFGKMGSTLGKTTVKKTC